MASADAADLDGGFVMVRSFGAVLRDHADARGAEIAIAYPGGTLSWTVLEARTAALARRMIAAGVRPDDLVGVALPNGVDHHVASFAAWRAGATPCILPTRLPEHEFAQIVELAAPRLIVSDGGAGVGGVIGIAADAGDVSVDPPSDLPPDLAAAHWKAVTSGGSTGRPKLIVDHAEARFGERLEGIVALTGMPRGGVMLNPGPLYHNAPFLFTSLALLAGTRVVGMDRFDAEAALRLIAEERVEWVCMVPTMMHRIWSLPDAVKARYDLSALRTVLHLAAPCPPWLKRAWIDWLGANRILELYAGTEGAAVLITGTEWLARPGSVGKPADGALSVRDEQGRPCPPGTVGEIFFAAEAATRFHYIGAEPRLDGEGWMSLGDLGWIDADGYLFLSDRRTDMILRGGANIYPAEVEAALIEHPGIADAVVLGLPCDDLGARVHAIVQLAADLPAAGIDAFVRARLAGYKCPESYETTDAPLRDEAGKVRRSALRDERLAWLAEGRDFRIARG
ncbi:AMP-binding protein [Sphingomonas colocasiae]|uniref:AMP-binding protein n=1 Tax=Sphingomonas colocasiae TaxID=1848973 RepID=A0ABS7PUC3_9SPHN|nr:AMP-binding protein [Sphingomonas colocasiae]MBY8824947.1 AMP-binding protein [Sphingomonas colocasiae]